MNPNLYARIMFYSNCKCDQCKKEVEDMLKEDKAEGISHRERLSEETSKEEAIV